ncbi:MAG: ABC transporter permease [Longimicrobiales bacterium]
MTRFLLALLRLFPREFRRQFGADMREQIVADHDRARARGFFHGVAFGLGTAVDLVRSAAVERMDPTWVERDTDTNHTGGMGMTTSVWMRDLRHAVRALMRVPGFTAAAVGTLALAIGANAGIFSVVDTVLLEPLPYAHADRLVRIAASAPGSDLPDEFGVSAEFYHQYREESRLLEDVATYNTFTNTLRVDDRTERVWMSSPSVSLFATLGADPILGRLPTDEDDGRAVVISHALWSAWFDRDPGVLGASHYIGGQDRTIVGVMGPDFWFPDDRIMLWIGNPMRTDNVRPGRFGLALIARVAPDTDRESLVRELTVLASRLPERFGGSADYARLIEQHRPVVRSLEDDLIGPVASSLWVLLGAVGVVLLIACGNVANLFVVRAEHRQRDLAVRRALGAGRGELVRAMLAEALVVSAAAGLLAILIARLALPLFLTAAPEGLPGLDRVELTPSAVAFTVGVSVLAALLCGLLPALGASRVDLARLRDGTRGSTSGRHPIRDLLVAGQTALALVLLIGSGLLIRSFTALRTVDPGYDLENLYTFQIAPEGRDDLVDGPSYARFHLGFKERIAALPGVESVGIIENIPLNEGVNTTRFVTERTAADEDGGALLGQTFADGDNFATMGISVLRGRPFRAADHTSEPGNAVVSQEAASLLWPGGEDPLGRRFRLRDQEAMWFTVVGVVEDVLQYGFRDTPQPLVYLPMVGPTPEAWALSSPAYVVRTERTGEIGAEIRAIVNEIAPGAPMYRMYTMEGLAADSMRQLSFTMLTLGVASALALILGAVGLFAVLSYTVAQRTREIGVRMALGAQATQVRRMVVRQGTRVVAAGVIVGLAVALVASRALARLLYGVGALDVGTFVGMSAMMMAVGLFASWLPARKASGVDPIESLRT